MILQGDALRAAGLRHALRQVARADCQCGLIALAQQRCHLPRLLPVQQGALPVTARMQALSLGLLLAVGPAVGLATCWTDLASPSLMSACTTHPAVPHA